eukprot:CAMPEP_0183750700 /NCGR_PEP_ID=MMETSP0739-20130205/1256_1 /TAXON_ID=385413 /ORGANISM="Thalassiosira miniscula, Strain CCMP1093" /LENGTH=546 /DNA_ID=CAMNT_0025986791 /DNA_START=46 /DNA_END=1687 /DNA_ORIENTATION=+
MTIMERGSSSRFGSNATTATGRHKHHHDGRSSGRIGRRRRRHRKRWLFYNIATATAVSLSMRLLLLMTKMLMLLSLALLANNNNNINIIINDGTTIPSSSRTTAMVVVAMAAFRNPPIMAIRKNHPQQQQHGPFQRRRVPSSLSKKSTNSTPTTTTALSYKTSHDGEEDNRNDNDHHRSGTFYSRSKRTKLRSTTATSTNLTTTKKKKNKKKKYKAARRNRTSRSYKLHKKGMPVSSDELANHVQSIFSDLNEFRDTAANNSEEEEEEDCEEDVDEPCVLEEEEEKNVQEEGQQRRRTTSSLSTEVARKKQLANCRKLDRHSALVLNADYQPLRMLPLSVWSWQDTVKAVLSGKAVVVDIYPDVYVRAASLDMPVPSVIALLEYAPTGKARPAFTRRNVFLRDGYRCQYCSELFRTGDLSLDHVEPRCFGGKLSWDNTVTCCKKCKGRKGCLRPSELHSIGMELKSTPRCPSLYELAAEATKFVPRKVHPTWAPFLGVIWKKKKKEKKTMFVEKEEEEDDLLLKGLSRVVVEEKAVQNKGPMVEGF